MPFNYTCSYMSNVRPSPFKLTSRVTPTYFLSNDS